MSDNSPSRSAGGRGALGVIFLTVFLDLVGFGIVIPILPLYAEDFGGGAIVVGGIMAIYSLMQFLFSPVWGRWSDRVGRKPLMLLGTGGAVISYTVFAMGSSFEGGVALAIFFVARLLGGFFGANLAVSQAFIADLTPPEKRSKSMALIGIAFGLGFILGPFLGGISLNAFGLAGPGWVAAGLCALNFILAAVLLPRTRPKAPAVQQGRFQVMRRVLARPQLAFLLLVFFLATLAFTSYEVTLGLLVAENFSLDYKGGDAARIANLFAYCGVIGVLAQGGLIGRLLALLGEVKLIALSLLLTGLALIPLPHVTGWFGLLVTLGVLSVGASLTRPPVFGMISQLSPDDEQGAFLGVAQSVGSLARIIGPMMATALFFHAQALPYLVFGCVCVVLAGLVLVKLRPLDAVAPKTGEEAVPHRRG